MGAEADKKDQQPNEVVELLKGMQAQQQSFARDLAGIKTQLAAPPKASAPAPKPAEKKPISQVYLQDEEAAFSRVKEEAKQEAKTEIKEELQRDNRQAQVLTDLRSAYPELNQDDHALTQEALRTYYALPKHEQTPAGMELAVLKAAAKTGVKPVAERAAPEEDDFVVGSGNGSRRETPREGKGKRKDGLDSRTAEFAQLLGRDVEKVKPFAERSTWGRYRGRGEK